MAPVFSVKCLVLPSTKEDVEDREKVGRGLGCWHRDLEDEDKRLEW